MARPPTRLLGVCHTHRAHKCFETPVWGDHRQLILNLTGTSEQRWDPGPLMAVGGTGDSLNERRVTGWAATGAAAFLLLVEISLRR